MSAPLRPRLRRLWVAVLVAALPASGCITRQVRDVVVDDGYTQIILRSEKRGTKVVEKGYDHPAYIASVRVAHILSRIELRREGERVPAIPLETLYTIADGIAEALEEASPNQAIAVQSIRRDKRWGVFDRKYLTSLLVYMKDDLLYVHVSRPDWEIPPRREKASERGGVPLPETYPGEHPLDFRLLSDEAMALVDHQTVAVQWRDDIFKRPTRTRVTPTGRVVRRTVLMESMEDETDYGPEPSRSVDDLSLEQLQALARLEEARRDGLVTEAEYAARKRSILAGELGAGEEEGAAPEPEGPRTP